MMRLKAHAIFISNLNKITKRIIFIERGQILFGYKLNQMSKSIIDISL